MKDLSKDDIAHLGGMSERSTAAGENPSELIGDGFIGNDLLGEGFVGNGFVGHGRDGRGGHGHGGGGGGRTRGVRGGDFMPIGPASVDIETIVLSDEVLERDQREKGMIMGDDDLTSPKHFRMRGENFIEEAVKKALVRGNIGAGGRGMSDNERKLRNMLLNERAFISAKIRGDEQLKSGSKKQRMSKEQLDFMKGQCAAATAEYNIAQRLYGTKQRHALSQYRKDVKANLRSQTDPALLYLAGKEKRFNTARSNLDACHKIAIKNWNGRVAAIKAAMAKAQAQGQAAVDALQKKLSGARGDFMGSNSTNMHMVSPGVGKVFIGRIGAADPRAKDEEAKAETMRRQILAKAGKEEIPAGDIDAFIGALNRAYMLTNGKAALRTQTHEWKQKIVAEIADLGGKIKGTIVSGMGFGWSDITDTAGKIVGKTVEYTGRAAFGVTKAVVWDAPKATFFPGGGGGDDKKDDAPTLQRARTPVVQQQQAISVSRSALTTSPAPAPAPYVYRPTQPSSELVSYARRIALQQAGVKKRQKALQSRLALAESKKALADAEAADEAATADLEARAVTAEAEASMLGADQVAEAAALQSTADQARLGKAALENMGPYAKEIVTNGPKGKFFSWARQTYKEIKSDADAPKKAALMQAVADEGNPQAQVAMQLLAIGKKADEEMTIANIANKDLQDQMLTAKGAAAVVGLVPSNAGVIDNVPSAKKIYDLAKQGNPSAVKSVANAGALMKRAAAGDQMARNRIKALQAAAAQGDESAQLQMAVIAVASAGIREGAYIARVTGEYRRGRGASLRGEDLKKTAEGDKRGMGKIFLETASRDIGKTFGPKGLLASSMNKLLGGERVEQGIALKIDQREKSKKPKG